MYKASAGVLLPTSIIGSLPRPAWHTVQLGSRSFLEAMVNARWREQYEDAVSTHLRAQEVAGLDICTDGDAHYDEEIGGWSWQSYPLTHMAGFSREVALTPPAVAAAAPPRGLILHDQAEAWHKAGVANGGTSIEDPPGVRPNGAYLAYLRDPDGHKLVGVARAAS